MNSSSATIETTFICQLLMWILPVFLFVFFGDIKTSLAVFSEADNGVVSYYLVPVTCKRPQMPEPGSRIFLADQR